MKSAPKVSVMIPTHNRAKLLVRSVSSVLSQTFTDFECIIVDDASQDSTPDVVAGLMRTDDRIRYHRHEISQFHAGSRNTGLRLARGEFLAFHDDDDEWLPAKLERQLVLFEKLPEEYGCVYCWADFVDADGAIIRRHRPSVRGDAYASTLVHNAIGCNPSLMIRRGAAERTGPWNEKLRTEEDNEYIIRLCRVCKVDFVPEVLVRVHTGHGGPQVSAVPGPEGLRYALEALEARYALFREERLRYPRQAAALEALMANVCIRLGDRRSGVRHFSQAFRLAPLSWEPYHMLLSLAKWGVRNG